MTDLFRSTTMSYVRILMTDESSTETLTALGEFGNMQIVDLSLKSNQVYHQHNQPLNPHDQLHSAANERRLRLKKRAAACAAYEKRLLQLRELTKQFDVEMPELIDLHIDNQSISQSSDAVDEVAKFMDPFEANISSDILFKRHQTDQIKELIDQIAVIQAVFTPMDQAGNQPVRSSDRSPLTQSRIERYGSFENPEEKSLLSGDYDSDDEEKSSAAAPANTIARLRREFSQLIAGTIAADKKSMFDRLLFRLSRGNAIVRYFPYDAREICSSIRPSVDQSIIQTISEEPKLVFTILFVGLELASRIKRVVGIVEAAEYEVPDNQHSSFRLVDELRVRLSDMSRVLVKTDEQIILSLSQMSYDTSTATSPWWQYKLMLERERGLCEAARCCDVERDRSSMLVCEGWVPTHTISQLKTAVANATLKSQLQPAALQIVDTPVRIPDSHNTSESETLTPPTYFPVNKFTTSFQSIVATYGIARYKEVNPGLFTIISFPFLFGVMFGDLGHGTILFIVGLLMVLYEAQLVRMQQHGKMHEIACMLFDGRYMVLMMGAFAIYCGFIYNDCFSIPVPLFDSPLKYAVTHGDSKHPHAPSSVYPFGVDWYWYHSSNELAFFNSMKMKMSVIIGVIQMLFGLCLSALNHTYNRDKAALVLEFVPRMTFLLCTFGYMIALILYKWTIDFTAPDAPPAANLIQTMINMFLAPGQVAPENQLYSGQAVVQTFLLLLAFASVPVMLFGMPFYERRQHRDGYVSIDHAVDHADDDYEHEHDDHDDHGVELAQSSLKQQQYQSVSINLSDDDEEVDEKSSGLSKRTRKPSKPHSPIRASAAPGSEPITHGYSFSDRLITSGIHTIEFVLGCVSNTASYLRLWALSLAHAQLASVFWNKMLAQYGYQSGSAVLTFAGFAVWVMATVAVLLCMDALECFLHALRLHWVEFQNKFYAADGVEFLPFNFKHIKEE